MKRIIIAAAILFAGIPAMAQTQQPAPQTQQAPAPDGLRARTMPPQERATMYTNQLKQQLNLTDDQYQKVLQVNTECIKRKDAAKAAGGDERQSMKDIAMYRRQQFQTILTPDQMAKLKEMNQQRREDRGNRMNGQIRDLPMNNNEPQ